MRQFLYGLKSDESLMLAYQCGDVAAFEVLYMRHKNSLFAFISRSCPAQVVEEIAQETWAVIIDGAGRYQVKAKFRTFLYQIAHNKIVDYWRRQKTAADIIIDACDVADDTTSKHEQQYHHNQLIRAIRQLPAEQRDAFLLREQGFSQSEIAEITGSGRETVKSRLRYATNTLRQQFEVSL